MGENISQKVEYKHRWRLVYVAFFLQFCSLYAFQDFSSNHDYFKKYFMSQISGNDFEFYFNVIYSVSLMFLIYFAIYAGVICDRLGPSVVVLVQWVCMLGGAFLMCISIHMQIFWILFIGRTFIFMGNSTMWISLGTFILQFFENNEQSTPQAVMTTAVLALFVNLNLAPVIVQNYGILTECYLVLFVCMICVLISLVVYNLEQKLDRQIGVDFQRDNKDFEFIGFLKEFSHYPRAFFFYMTQNFLSLIVSTIIEIVGPAFIAEYWGKTPEEAGRICALGPLTSVFLILVGKIADKFQKHTQIMIIASFLHIVAMIMMPNLPITEISFIVYGFAFSIRMMLTFPIQSLLVPKRASGKTYALTRASKDVFGFIIAFVNGLIAEKYGYAPVIYIQAGISVLVTISAIMLHLEYKKMVRENDPYLVKLDRINHPDLFEKFEKESHVTTTNNDLV